MTHNRLKSNPLILLVDWAIVLAEVADTVFKGKKMLQALTFGRTSKLEICSGMMRFPVSSSK